MIDRALHYSTGEATSEFDGTAWNLTPDGSFLYPNTASVTSDLGFSEPLLFDTQGYLLSTMKDEPSPESNHMDISPEAVVQHHTTSPVELENTMIERQAVLPEAVHAHSNPETPSRPDQTFQTDSPLIPHAHSDSGLAAHSDFQEQLQLHSSMSPYGYTNNALPGLAGMANRINSMRHQNAHHPQVSSPLAQPTPLYNAQNNAQNFFHLPIAHNDSSPYDDEGIFPAYTDSLQNPNHYFNSNPYQSYGASPLNQMSRRRPQSVVPSNDTLRSRAVIDNMTLEPMPQFMPNHPGLRPNIPPRGRSFTQPSAPPVYRGRVPSQASSRYSSHPQQSSSYQQATGVGRRASFQQRSFDDYEEDADDTTSSGWQPIRQDYQLTDPPTELVYQDLTAVKAERKAYTHRAVMDDDSYPKNDEEQRHYVKRMLDAMNDMSIADDNVKMQGIWAKQKKNQRDVELACWQLLELCMKATRQEEHLEPKATPKPVNTYTTFGHRVSEICKTLQQSKTICKHMLMPHYTATFVDDPEAAFSRVRNNRNVNNKKKMYLQQAKTVAQQQKEEEAARLGAQEWTEEDVAEEGYDFLAEFNQKQSPAPRPKAKKAAKRRKGDDDDDAPFKGTPPATRRGRRNNSMYQLAPLDNGRAEIVDTSNSSNRRTRRATTGGENFVQPNYAVDSQDEDDDDENDLDYFDYHTRNQNIGYSPSAEYQADFIGPQGYAQPQEVQQPRKRARR